MNKKIQELIEKRAKAWEGTKAFVESKKDSDGLLSKEDVETYNKMEEKVKNFTFEIERLQEMENMERELSKPVNDPLISKPMVSDKEDKIKKNLQHKKAMIKALRSNFRQIENILQEKVDTDGGYLVPDEYDSRLVDTLEEENIIRKLSQTLKTNGKHKINIAATSPAAAWVEEGGELKFGEATFKQVLLDAHKLHVAIKVTEELLYDSMFDLESYILEKFGKALANAEEDAFLNGDGSGKPTGIFAQTNGGTHLTEVDALKADDIINLIHALKRPYRKKAAFILNDKIIANIRKLKDNNGAYIWQPSYQLGEPDKLAGYPVYTSAFAPENKIAFGDFSYYNIGDRGARSFKELQELFAGNGMIGFVAKERVDGKLVLPEAVQILPIKG